MTNFRLTVAYDGGRYKGWQRLGGGENTIQGKLEGVLSRLYGKTVEIDGASRTDAGVHALKQTACFRADETFPPAEIEAYCSRYLPDDISVLSVRTADEHFHPRMGVQSKTYLYQIWNRPQANPFFRKYSMHVPERLDIAAMRAAAEQLQGRHDFTAFSNAKSKKKSMVREIMAIEVMEKEGLIQLRFQGGGFLHHMVRRMTGVLIEAGQGRISADAVPGMLEAKERSAVQLVAEAKGLFLQEVRYRSNI